MENKIRGIRIGSSLIGALFLLTSLKAHNQTSNVYAGISSLYCFNSGKIERMTGKKRSTLSPKVIKAWKMGNLGFTYSKYCGLAQINPMAIGEARWHSIKELSDEAGLVLAQLQSPVETGPVLVSEKRAAKQFGELASRMNYAAGCGKKFASDSSFGPMGRVVKEALSKNSAKELLNHDISFGGACPGYIEMTGEQRKNLWVFVMMSMSHFESSCQQQVSNVGPYGTAAGLLQLHEESEHLYVNWDPDLNCDKGAARNAASNLKCALTMIGNQLFKGVPFFNDRSHWQVLRNVEKPGSQAYHIRYAISQIPDCKANPFYIDVNLRRLPSSNAEVFNHKTPINAELAMLR